MKFEIESLAVGEASCAGDAIVVRYGDASAYHLMLVDGGHSSTGDKIVAHLRGTFGNDVVLEHVVLTHSDADHASGLRIVLSEIPVQNLWLHIPWSLAETTLFEGNWNVERLRVAIKKEYDIISELLDLANDQGCSVHYPFEGEKIGPFVVCNPTFYAYQHLLPQFDKTPAPNQALIESKRMWLGKESAARRFIENARTALTGWAVETWFGERLRDGGKTSASNETSVVLFGQFEGGNVLLTGDAGTEALAWSANYLTRSGLPLQQFSVVQIPHHGSRRNVGPSVLNQLIGSIKQEGSAAHFTAFVSAPADDSKHPRRIVTNAFRRRGAQVIATQGQDKLIYGGFPKRDGYVDASLLPFYDVVEEYD